MYPCTGTLCPCADWKTVARNRPVPSQCRQKPGHDVGFQTALKRISAGTRGIVEEPNVAVNGDRNKILGSKPCMTSGARHLSRDHVPVTLGSVGDATVGENPPVAAADHCRRSIAEGGGLREKRQDTLTPRLGISKAVSGGSRRKGAENE